MAILFQKVSKAKQKKHSVTQRSTWCSCRLAGLSMFAGSRNASFTARTEHAGINSQA
jgi:hypothetical protein